VSTNENIQNAHHAKDKRGIMKNVIFLIVCFFALSSFSAEIKCENQVRHAGIFYNECPPGLVVTGTDVRVSGNPPFPFVTTVVECGRVITTCKAEEKLNEQTSKPNNNN